MQKNCVICGNPFWALGSQVTCSPGCRKKRTNENRKRIQTPEYFRRYNEANRERLRVQRRAYRRQTYCRTVEKCGAEPVECPKCGEKGIEYIQTDLNRNTGHKYILTLMRHVTPEKKIVFHYMKKKPPPSP